MGTRTVLRILILFSFSPSSSQKACLLRSKAEGKVAIFGRLVLLLALVARVGADRGLREDDARSPAALARDFFEPRPSRPRLGLTETNHGREADVRGPRAVVGAGERLRGEGWLLFEVVQNPAGLEAVDPGAWEGAQLWWDGWEVLGQGATVRSRLESPGESFEYEASTWWIQVHPGPNLRFRKADAAITGGAQEAQRTGAEFRDRRRSRFGQRAYISCELISPCLVSRKQGWASREWNLK